MRMLLNAKGRRAAQLQTDAMVHVGRGTCIWR
jgi:hypothetical protein